MPKAIPEISIESTLLIDRLKTLEVDEVVTWDELSNLIGRDVRKEAYHNLGTARNRLLRDERMVFECVRKVGVKRLSDDGIVVSAESGLQRIKRASRRSFRKLSCADALTA